MAYGYWKLGRSEQEAVFHLFFRKPPFAGGYAVAAGLSSAVEFLESFSFDRSDIDYLDSLSGNDGQPLFEPDFLAYLGDLRLTCAVDAMSEGTVAFGQEPLVRVRGADSAMPDPRNPAAERDQLSDSYCDKSVADLCSDER